MKFQNQQRALHKQSAQEGQPTCTETHTHTHTHLAITKCDVCSTQLLHTNRFGGNAMTKNSDSTENEWGIRSLSVICTDI